LFLVTIWTHCCRRRRWWLRAKSIHCDFQRFFIETEHILQFSYFFFKLAILLRKIFNFSSFSIQVRTLFVLSLEIKSFIPAKRLWAHEGKSIMKYERVVGEICYFVCFIWLFCGLCNDKCFLLEKINHLSTWKYFFWKGMWY